MMRAIQSLLLVILVATQLMFAVGKNQDEGSSIGMRSTRGNRSKKGRSSQRDDVCNPVDLTNDSDVSFELICTGSTGGAKLTDMTGYVFRRADPRANMIQLDGGTQTQGLEVAAKCGHFDALLSSSMDDKEGDDDDEDGSSTTATKKAQLAWQRIVGQTVSHPHLDHVADFIVMSQELTFGGNFPVYARESILQDLQTHIFNFRIWPDFFNIGFSPQNNTLLRRPLEPFRAVMMEKNVGLNITAFPLHHDNPGGSTAFLLQEVSSDGSGGAAFLAIFDTNPDSILQDNGEMLPLRAIWEYVAPLVIDGRLKGIMMESSFVTEIKDGSLFGHLTPCYVLQELRSLANAVNGGDGGTPPPLQGLNVLIMHVKWKVLDPEYIETVRNEFDLEHLDNLQGTCSEANDLGVRFTFVEQGGRYLL